MPFSEFCMRLTVFPQHCWHMDNDILVFNKPNICFTDYAKAFVWITTNWKSLKEMEIPDHLTCLLRNLCEGKKQHLELDMEQFS